MFLKRALIACLLAMTWLSAVIHAEMESLGWMLDHSHGHVEHHADDTMPNGVEGHESVLAQNAPSGGRLFQLPGFSDVAGPAFLGGLIAWITLLALPFSGRLRPPKTRGDPIFASPWQFILRCAPESAAPPARS